MNRQPPLLLAHVALMLAAAANASGPREETADMPSLELLEYLAEFERSDDGRLLDPLDLERESDDDAPQADARARPTR